MGRRIGGAGGGSDPGGTSGGSGRGCGGGKADGRRWGLGRGVGDFGGDGGGGAHVGPAGVFDIRGSAGLAEGDGGDFALAAFEVVVDGANGAPEARERSWMPVLVEGTCGESR